MKKALSLLPFVVILCFCSSFIEKKSAPSHEINRGYKWEEYNPDLFYRLQSIKDLLSYADSAVGAVNRQTLLYSEFLAATIRKRFYHGFCYYSTEDNWLAFLAGKLVWNHLHAIVLPNDILAHPMAACSQQAIVLKECFESIGVDYRVIELKGHFVIEGKVKGQWYLFDTNLEPRFWNGRKSLQELMATKELYNAYGERLTPGEINEVFSSPIYESINSPVAPQATLFQRVAYVLSYTFPIVLIGSIPGWLWLKRRSSRSVLKKTQEVKFWKPEGTLTKERRARATL